MYLTKSMVASIIIVNWNTKDILLKCLGSISKQDRAICKEVIVVDNGSTDGSVDAIHTHFPQTIVIENYANIGFARANNVGINKSTGRYVCLVNSDVELLDGCLLRLIEYMDANPDIGIAGPKIYYPDLTLQNSCRKFPTLWNNLSPALGFDKLFRNSPAFSGEHMRYFTHDVNMNVDYLAGCFLVVRREALEEVGLLDEQFFIYREEVDWCKRFHQHGWKISFFPNAMAIHHHGASSSKDPKRFALASQKALFQYWEKHHSTLSVITIRLILILRHSLRLILRAVLYCIRKTNRRKHGQKLKMDLAYLSELIRFPKIPRHFRIGGHG